MNTIHYLLSYTDWDPHPYRIAACTLALALVCCSLLKMKRDSAKQRKDALHTIHERM